MEDAAELYKFTSASAERYRKEKEFKKEAQANRQLISQLKRNVREFGWDPQLSLLQIELLLQTNADIVD